MCRALRSERPRRSGGAAARRGAQPDRNGPHNGPVEADRRRDAGIVA